MKDFRRLTDSALGSPEKIGAGVQRERRGGIRDAVGGALGQDLRISVRRLAKSPGFTAIAVIMLAVGIGSATAMFSVIRAFVIQPYSSPNGERLVHLWSNGGQPLSTAEYFAIRDHATSFTDVGVYAPRTFNLGGDHPESVRGVACTPGALRVFGGAPELGRWLNETDEQKGAAPVAVISHHLWQQSFAADPELVGRSIRLDGADVLVVGVMPDRFEFSAPWMAGVDCDIWQSFQVQRDQPGSWWCAVGCLKQGVTPAAAEAGVKAICAQVDSGQRDAKRKSFEVTTLRYELTRYGSSYAWMIFAATLLVLVVACANVGSMLLARGARRQGEFGVRMALGADRRQIFRLVFSEIVLLALAGTIVGAGFAAAALHFFRYLVGVSNTRLEAMVLDGNVFVFAGALALASAVMAGFPSAISALRLSVADLLRADSHSATGCGRQHRLLRGLVVAQIAVAFIVGNIAVLFSTSYANMLSSNARLSTDYVLSSQLDLHGPRYATNGAQFRFCRQLAERAAAVPGVGAAGIATDLPLEWGPSATLLANDETFDPAVQRPAVVFTAITPGYFAAAEIPLLQGRTLQDSDVGRNDIGVVVNRAFVEKYWPGQDPLGKVVRPNSPTAWYHGNVVGVVESVRQWGVKSEPQPELYWTMDRAWGSTIYLVVRSSRPAVALTPALRRAIAELDPDLPLSRVRTFKTIVREATQGDRAVAGLTNYCMVVAILLVAIGLYGTLSYLVLQRTPEIGVRIALGAFRRDVVQLVFRQGFRWTLLGVVLGTGGAVALARSLRAMLYSVDALNPASLAATAAAVVLAATLACWLPARRASRVDPIEALRCE